MAGQSERNPPAGRRRGKQTELNWSEAVEDLVTTGDTDAAIALLESVISNLENKDSPGLASALCDLAKLYSSKGFSLKADDLQSRASLIKLRHSFSFFWCCCREAELDAWKATAPSQSEEGRACWNVDPMATVLSIICVGKATKFVDSYQGLTKGYSGVSFWGETTSTWDVESPVIQLRL